MNLGTFLEQAQRVVDCDGDPCDFGCAEKDIPGLINHGKALFPTKPYRVVKEWCWVDIETNENLDRWMAGLGVLPAFLYANDVIEDESNKFLGRGIKVKTTPLVAFKNNSIFVTRNTIYILVGRGRRTTVALDVYTNLFF